MRKLATARKITNILPIKDADMIEEIVIDGWSVVAQKGIHCVGNTVLYFEIDSFLPESDSRFGSFMKFGTINEIFNEAYLEFNRYPYDQVSFEFNGVEFIIDNYTSNWGRSIYEKVLSSVEQRKSIVYL